MKALFQHAAPMLVGVKEKFEKGQKGRFLF